MALGLRAEANWFTEHTGSRLAGGWSWCGTTQHQVANTPRCERTEEADREHKGKAAQARVQRGRVSRARQELRGPSWPRKTRHLNELRDKRPHEQFREVSGDLFSFQPEAPVQCDRRLYATSLRGASSSSGR